jgi:hypothetical protein
MQKNDIRISTHVLRFMPLNIEKEIWIKDKIQSEIYTLTFVIQFASTDLSYVYTLCRL